MIKLPTGSGSENCLPVGTRLGEFEIRGVIGEGGFGIVYLAFDESLHRTVAVKEYMPSMLAARGDDKSVTVRAKQHQETFGKGLRSFINEARLLAQFDHPSLIKVYRFWEQNNTGYMAMRYYEGSTLKHIVADDPSVVTEAWLKSVLGQILEALETLYRDNVLHRDISPDNIMVQSDGHAVLLDFGAARQIISDMTQQTLTVILKPGYAPVEQYADDDSMTQGPWTDIYSLAAVTYFVITGKPPATSVGRMIKDPIEPLEKSGRAGFSSAFLAAIDKGLGIRPEDRPQSIAEFRALLGLGTKSEPVAPVRAVSKTSGDAAKAAAISGRRRSDRRPEARPAARKSPLSKEMILIGAGVVLIASAAVVHSVRRHAALAEAEQAIPVTAPPVKQVVDEEALAWGRLQANADAKPEDIETYLQRYPTGAHADQAKARLETLKAASAAAAASVPEAPVTAATPVEKPKKAETTVKLMVRPWGNIFVDGMLKGVSPPLKSVALSEGKHRVRIENPNFNAHVIDIEADGKKKPKIEYDFNADKKPSST